MMGIKVHGAHTGKGTWANLGALAAREAVRRNEDCRKLVAYLTRRQSLWMRLRLLPRSNTRLYTPKSVAIHSAALRES